ncbi:MAG: DVU_1556 family methyltransferase [Desulforhopalus sp.]
MTSKITTALYEQEELSQVTGGALRPGGLTLTTELLACRRPVSDSTILDVGCGAGHTAAVLATDFGLRPTGLDPSTILLAKAVRQAPAAAFIQGVATAIPCRSQSFETVIAECVLSLTGDIEQSLREIYRVLQPGGVLFLSDIYRKQAGPKPELSALKSCITHARSLATIKKGLYMAGFALHLLQDRSELLKQLAGQIIFSHGSLEKFWQLFMGTETARQTCCALAAAPLGYYALIAEKGAYNG